MEAHGRSFALEAWGRFLCLMEAWVEARELSTCIKCFHLFCGIMIQYQNSQHKEERPKVLLCRFIIRAYPAVLPLMVNYIVNIVPGPRFHILVIQQPRQWNKSIKPIRKSFPSFCIPSNPFAVFYIRPELIKIARKPIGLNPQLVQQPTFRLDFLDLQRPISRFPKLSVFNLFVHV